MQSTTLANPSYLVALQERRQLEEELAHAENLIEELLQENAILERKIELMPRQS